MIFINLKSFVLKLIKLYQATRSLRAPACRFEPSCSEYAAQAIDKHGLFKGSWLAINRVGRCHPLNKDFGYDPVP